MAKLCTLRLLQQLQQEDAAASGRVMCISFAAPPLGNAALADVIAHRGWDGHFYNLTLPGPSPSEPRLPPAVLAHTACTADAPVFCCMQRMWCRGCWP